MENMTKLFNCFINVWNGLPMGMGRNGASQNNFWNESSLWDKAKETIHHTLYYLIMSFPKGLYVDNSTPTFTHTEVEQWSSVNGWWELDFSWLEWEFMDKQGEKAKMTHIGNGL